MSNVLSMEEALMRKMQKHLDLADTWFETGDMLAYDDHMKISESLMSSLDNLVVMEMKNRKVL